MKVLVIDASAAVRSRIVALLAEGGITIIGEVATSSHARAFVRMHSPDAVVLDVDLPDRDGLALISDLRALAPNVSVVILTNALAYRRRCMVLGADAFLDKSVDFCSIVEVLNARRPSRRASR